MINFKADNIFITHELKKKNHLNKIIKNKIIRNHDTPAIKDKIKKKNQLKRE